MKRGGRVGTRVYSTAGLRAHHAKYNIDEPARRRFKTALAAMVDHDEAMQRALEAGGLNTGFYVFTRVRDALKLLVHGENGEFP